ncbi:MAG TPA: putative glycoside hydrolase [Candidatus Deferrimicrobiaceae bacterium]|nr:putative glycoside hydrolase [Candidatus Deferrimicrobiaceae bacterium]
MDHSPLPRSMSWTSLLILTLLAALAEAALLFPAAVLPTTRFAAALSWDASRHTYPTPETPAGDSAVPETVTPAAPAPQTPTPAAPAARAITGRVLDAATGSPLRGVSVWAGPTEIVTGADGRFTTEPVEPGAPVWVKTPGYERKKLVAGEASDVTVKLVAHAIRAAYLTYYGVADRGIRQRVLDLVERTELNAVVIDIKGDRGLIPYRTTVPAALEAGALGPVIIKDFDEQLAAWKARGIYTIARIVAFKDNMRANARPDLAVIDTRTGKPWIDRENLAWIDPFREESWDYIISVAKEAALKGFDEIQFDYVRFPTDGKLSAARYSQPNTPATRLPAIAAFLAKARRELGPTGVFLAADIFGYTAFNTNDTDIGQRIEEISVSLDYICPMVYPSGYHLGIPGVRNPVSNPYEIVKESVRLTRQRSQNPVAHVRPWLQDFKDYAFDKRIFGPGEVRAQIRGSDDGGGVGWMLWNPRNDYTAAALRPKTAALSTSSR